MTDQAMGQAWLGALAGLPPVKAVYRGFGEGTPQPMIGCGLIQPSAHNNLNYKSTLHMDYSLCYVLRGRGMYCDTSGHSWPLGPGMVFQRIPGMTHSSFADADSGYLELFLFLPETLFGALAALGILPVTRLVWNAGLQPELLAQYARLYHRLERVAQLGAAPVLADMLRLLSSLVAANIGAGTRDQARLEAARHVLSNRFGADLNLSAVAAENGMSYETFRKWFHRHAGRSPKEYNVERRIERAQALLLNPSNCLKSVAAQLGYCDLPAFCKQFKSVTGLPAAEWRRRATSAVALAT